MIRIVYVFALFAAIAICSSVARVPRKLEPRITGTGYAQIKSLPYQAQLVRDNMTLFCGATIIDKQWLLSASHCFLDGFDSVTILTGSTYRLKGKKSYIEKVITHPSFNEINLNNDICLIKLQKPLEFDAYQNKIPMLYSELVPGWMIQISGYGRESDNSTHSPVIKLAHVPVIDTQVCKKRYLQIDDILTQSMFCAGDGRDDACLGDSGGPAVYNNHLVGIISAGKLCRSPEFPGVYTRLNIFWNWIESTMKFHSFSFEKSPNTYYPVQTPEITIPLTSVTSSPISHMLPSLPQYIYHRPTSEEKWAQLLFFPLISRKDKAHEYTSTDEKHIKLNEKNL